MTKIVDPDQLNLGTEVEIDTTGSPKTVSLLSAGNLEDSSPGASSGVTGQALYSFLKEEWLTNLDLNKHRFPLKAFTKFEQLWKNNFAPANAASRNILRDVGWEESVGVNAGDLYACFITLGTFDDPTDQAQYTQEAGFDAPVRDFTKTGEVNEPVLILDASEGPAGDFTEYFKAFLKAPGKTIDSYDILEEQALGSLEATVYRLPLSNGVDPRVIDSDATIDSDPPYTGMSVTYLAGHGFETYADGEAYDEGFVVRDVHGWKIHLGNGWDLYEGDMQLAGEGNYAFNRIIDANNATKEQIYQWVQRQLRKTENINTGVIADARQDTIGDVIGVNAEPLLSFDGENLICAPGVFVVGLNSNDLNNIRFFPIQNDAGGLNNNGVPVNPLTTPLTYPYVAAGTLMFSQNLLSEPDADTVYRMYFASTPNGNFNTDDAIIVNDKSGSPIQGQISGAAISFDFDFDGNDQGGRTVSEVAEVVVVFQGLNGAEWGEVAHTITRSTGQNVPCVAGDERNFYQLP